MFRLPFARLCMALMVLVAPLASADDLAQVDDFLYILQGYRNAAGVAPSFNWREMVNSDYDLIIMDYSWDGTHAARFSAEDLQELRKNRERLVLCYLSVGEAESYRFYWRDSWRPGQYPEWLGTENPAWPGNYKVRYWHPEWRTIVLGYLATIRAQGFDGIYLDVVDAFAYWADENAYGIGAETYNPTDPRGDAQTAADRMILFMHTLAETAREWDPDFLVVMQNAEQIVRFASDAALEQLWRTINGLGTEDLFYFGNQIVDSPLNPDRASRLELVGQYIQREKLVLATEYLTDARKIEHFCQEATKYGLVPFAAPSRSLDRYQIKGSCVSSQARLTTRGDE